jgi:hypothetical protein
MRVIACEARHGSRNDPPRWLALQEWYALPLGHRRALRQSVVCGSLLPSSYMTNSLRSDDELDVYGGSGADKRAGS